MDNKTALRPQIGSLDVKDIIRVGVRDVTGSFEMDFADLVQYNKFVSNQDVALVCTWTNSSRIYVLTMPRVHFTAGTPPTAGPGPYTVPFTFQALEQTRAAMDELKLTITNSISSVA